jgi:hypothetical protein
MINGILKEYLRKHIPFSLYNDQEKKLINGKEKMIEKRKNIQEVQITIID